MRVLVAVLLTLVSSALHAADGVTEINHACAVNGGCMLSDLPGYPVTIGVSGSYRLTGNLDMTATPEVNAIEIDTGYVALDLGGFRIRGFNHCSGTPGSSYDCTHNDPNANGVAVKAGDAGVRVFNGQIHGLRGSGIRAPDATLLQVDRVVVSNVGNSGFILGDQARLTHSVAHKNGVHGVEAGDHAIISQFTASIHGMHGLLSGAHAVVTESSAHLSGGRGFELGHSSRFGFNTSSGNSEPDRCGGGLCTPHRRYYLTPQSAAGPGGEALAACANGFHLAQFYELRELAGLVYDHALGLTAPLQDYGSGPPPSISGWVRSTLPLSGPNCQLWTTSSSIEDGAIMFLSPHSEWDDSPGISTPWRVGALPCNLPVSAWCIED